MFLRRRKFIAPSDVARIIYDCATYPRGPTLKVGNFRHSFHVRRKKFATAQTTLVRLLRTFEFYSSGHVSSTPASPREHKYTWIW